MGLFKKSEICSICNEAVEAKKLQDGCICNSCMRRCAPFILASSSWKNITCERVHKAIKASERNNQLLSKFQPTKRIENYISFDENNKLWKILSLNVAFNYDDILSFGLLKDGEAITQGGIGSAVVGGALFGSVGAIVGGVAGSKKTKTEVKEFRLKIITRNDMYSDVYIDFLLMGPVISGSPKYKSYQDSAQKIITELTVITNRLNSHQNQPAVSIPEEIMRYKNLLDIGAITQEEYEVKKQQLLGL